MRSYNFWRLSLDFNNSLHLILFCSTQSKLRRNMQIESLAYKSVIKSNIIVNTVLGTDEIRPSDRLCFLKEETHLL